MDPVIVRHVFVFYSLSRKIVLIGIHIDDAVRAGLNTLTVTLAFFMIDENNSIRIPVNCLFRAGRYTGWIIAMHTGKPEIDDMILRLALHFQYPLPPYLRRRKVLLLAGYNARHAACAPVQINEYPISSHDLRFLLSFVIQGQLFATSQGTSLKGGYPEMRSNCLGISSFTLAFAHPCMMPTTPGGTIIVGLAFT